METTKYYCPECDGYTNGVGAENGEPALCLECGHEVDMDMNRDELDSQR